MRVGFERRKRRQDDGGLLTEERASLRDFSSACSTQIFPHFIDRYTRLLVALLWFNNLISEETRDLTLSPAKR